MDQARGIDIERSAAYPGWRVLLASCIGLAFSPGPMIFGSLGLLARPIAKDFGWSIGQIMLSLTLFNVAGVLASPYTGRLIDRFGVRAILLPSLVTFVAGFLSFAYLVHSLAQLYTLALVWGALTVGTQSISYTKLLTVWFERRRGLAVGIAAAGLGLGYSIVPLMIAQLLIRTDWHTTLAMMALIIAVVPLPINALLTHPKRSAPGIRSVAVSGLSLLEARRTREFWYMAGAIFLASTALTGVVPHLALVALDRGFSAPEAAAVASTYGLSTIIGRILVGALADRYPVARVAMVFFGISTLGFLWAALLGLQPSLVVLALVALTIGLGFGAESDVIALFISRYFGQRSFGAIYGVLLAFFLIGAAAGPPLFGFGHDALGSYPPLMLAAAVIMLAAVSLLTQLGSAAPLWAGPARTHKGKT